MINSKFNLTNNTNIFAKLFISSNCLVIIGALFKIMHLPFANVILLLAILMSTSCILYGIYEIIPIIHIK
jgi:hypothetical protein